MINGGKKNMKAKRLLAAVVSVAIAAGQLAVMASAESSENETVSLPDAAVSTDTVTTDDQTTDEETTNNEIGDVNGDGKITITDVSMTAAHIKSIKALNDKSLKAADITGDGKINVSDLSLLAGHVKGIASLSEYLDLPVVKEPRQKQAPSNTYDVVLKDDSEYVAWNKEEDMTYYDVVFYAGDNKSETTIRDTNIKIPFDMFVDGKLNVEITPLRNVKNEKGERVKDYGTTVAYVLKKKPAALKGEIKQTAENGKIKLTWDKADFASGYHVYELDANNNSTLLADVADTQFTTDAPASGKKTIQVVPYNSVASAEGLNTTIEAAPVAETLPAPTLNSYYYYSDTHSVTALWNPVTGAEGYEAKVKTTDGTWKEATVKATSVSFDGLAQSTAFEVQVRAYKKNGNDKIYSDYVKITAVTDGYIKCKTATSIYTSADPNSAVLASVKAGDIIMQTDIPYNGWTKVFVPSSGGTQTGYVPTANFGAYSDSGIQPISQDGWLGGQPAVLGCEETSLATVLNKQFGIEVSKNTLLNYYMPEQAFSNGTINVDPNYCFWGSPYHMEGSVGYGCYAPLIAQSAHQYLRDTGVRGSYNIDLYTDYTTGENVNKLKFDPTKLDLGDTKVAGGLDINGLKNELDKGNNPIIWYSEIEPYAVCTQTLTAGTDKTNPGTGTYNFTWYGRQHTVVLRGYDDATGQFILANVENLNSTSDTGVISYVGYDFFMKTYTTLGRQTVVVTKK